MVTDSSAAPVSVTDNSNNSNSSNASAAPASVEVRVDPEAFRRVEEVVQERTAGRGGSSVVLHPCLTDVAIRVGSR